MGKPTFAALLERMRQMADYTVKVGVLTGAGTEADGTPLVEIAAVHEYGNLAGTIPQRSFIRSTFKRTHAERQRMVAELIKKVTEHESMDVPRALGLLGQWAVARVKETIVNKLTDGPEPQENKPATIKAKGGKTTPLIDTGLLKNSITYAVEQKK